MDAGRRFDNLMELVETLPYVRGTIDRVADAICDAEYGRLEPLSCSFDVLQKALHFWPKDMVAALFDCLGDDNVTELLAAYESYAVETGP